MAHTKSAGSTGNLRDSQPKYRGVKLFAGEKARTGNIIIRQTGSKFIPGEGVQQGRDYTLFAVRNGVIKFSNKRKIRFDGKRVVKKVVSVV